MNDYRVLRVFAVILIVFILIFSVVQIANLIRGDDPDEVAVDETPLVLGVRNYDTNRSKIRYTVDGPINGRDEHRMMRITITPRQRIIEILKGYEGDVIASRNYQNDADAYTAFIRALEYENFDAFQESEFGDDYIGVCPTGRRYVTELFDGASVVETRWAVSCTRKIGTLAGDLSSLKKLFIAQIPDYRDMTRGINVN